MVIVFIFFFKQKTAYEMRISDWSSDVCSSDLAVTELLVDRGERAAIVNGEMGCGKMTVGIATAAMLNAEGYRRTLVLSPPHLVYKWRREIQETVAGAKVWVLNDPDTQVKLLNLREQFGVPAPGQVFFVLRRGRLRLGFPWQPAFFWR